MTGEALEMSLDEPFGGATQGPVVGYRVWKWDGALKSLNGIEWIARKVFTAECRAQGRCLAPESNCTCGIYAGKSVGHLRRLGYTENRICGEVSLWGIVVEHEEGWRAQFAYPRHFVVPLSMVPLRMNTLELWLAALSAYGCGISIDGETGTVALWRSGSGPDARGLDVLVNRCNGWYARRAERRRLKPGDRVAVHGHGIAIVEHADSDHVKAVLGNRSVLRVERERIVWCEQYTRWETAAGARIGLTACRMVKSRLGTRKRAQKRF